MSKVKLWPLVPCAGNGSRAGSRLPKQYVSLNGFPVVGYTIKALQQVAGIEPITVVVAPEDTLFSYHCPDFDGVVADVGGQTRAQSVRAGLGVLRQLGAADGDWVLVHDAARCLVRPEWVSSLIESCLNDPVGGILAQPVADTLKQSVDGRSVLTITRQDKWMAQTPQMFMLSVLEKALDQAFEQGVAVTDEAAAVEALGLQPKLVACSPDNFKLTYPLDFERAGVILKARHC